MDIVLQSSYKSFTRRGQCGEIWAAVSDEVTWRMGFNVHFECKRYGI